MSPSSRKLLFRFSAVVFFIVGGLVVAYSFGIKLDLKRLTFSETGGIYVKSIPAEAEIYLDNKRIKNTSSFFQAGTLIDNLRKREYHLTLRENGYFSWVKTVNVSPSLVNVFDNIVMIQQKEPIKIAEPADKIKLLGDILLVEKNVSIYADKIKIFGNNIIDTTSNDSVITYNNANKNYYLVSLSNPSSYININDIFNNLKEDKLRLPGAVPILKVAFHPFNKDRLIIRSRGALYNIDITRSTIEKVVNGAVEFRTQGNNLFFYTTDGIYRYNLIFRTTTKLSLQKGQKIIKDFAGTSSGGAIVLYDNGELNLTFPDNLIKIADKAEIFSISDNGKLIAFGDTDQSLHIYDVEKQKYADIKNGVTGNLNKIIWYKDNNHLLLQSDDSVYFSEISETVPVNCFKIDVGAKDFSYNEDKNTVYINSANGVLKYEI